MVLYTAPRKAETIPLIDLGPSFSGDIEARRAVARQIRTASLDTGFFYVTGHGIPETLIQDQFLWSRRFFDQSLAEKMACDLYNSHSRSGYEPMAGQSLDADSPPDLKESYYCGEELPDNHPLAQAGVRGFGHNQWPAALPGFRTQMLAYHRALKGLGLHLMRLLALSLDLPEHHFDDSFSEPMANLRLIKYPPHPDSAAFNQIGAGAHTDWGGLTLLLQDDAGGLEVQDVTGAWLAAPPIPGSYVINLGDLIQKWTNDIYRSNFHRVRNSVSGGERYSVPFFYSPNPSARIECLPGCSDADRPVLHAPCTCQEHMDARWLETYGKM
ncbi:2-oxoglutarate and iron-dependent oxygenase domain-containing protein [Denitratisoma sp. agr-D3]